MFGFIIKSFIGILVSPILIPLLLIQGIQDDMPQNIERQKYLTDYETNYYKYNDIPYTLRPDFLSYNSYKDKILVIIDGEMYFAHKQINKITNKIVYITENNVVIEDNLEQYKIPTQPKLIKR
jgi:hypothetical protein